MKLGPRSIERPGDIGVTSVSVFGSESKAVVDGGGLVQVDTCDWSLDWWIGADDRWYYPSREATVRQRRIGFGPVIETSVRIPSGDAIQTVYAVNAGGRDVTVVEVTNDSPVPVALALAIRPYAANVASLASSETTLSFERLDDASLLVTNGVGSDQHQHIIGLPRKPNQIGSSSKTDLWAEIEQGSDLVWAGGSSGSEANAICLYPLPHKTSLRFVIADGSIGDLSSASLVGSLAVPEAEVVARGWTSIVDANSRFELPDAGLSQLANSARARIVGAAPSLHPNDGYQGGEVLLSLALGGYSHECENLLVQLAESFPSSIAEPVEAAAVLHGVAQAAAVVDKPPLTDRLLESMAQLLHLIERSKNKPAIAEGRRGLARLALVAGQLEPARQLWKQGSGSPVSGSEAAAEQGPASLLPTLAETASPAGRWTNDDGTDSVDQAVRYWLMTRNALLAEHMDSIQSGEPTVNLLPEFPSSWRGGPVEVHQAHTLFGRVSFAIRWHGYRPALLWEVEPARYLGSSPVQLRCPGLDSDWSTNQLSGETLLAGTTEELPDTPQPGDSFI